MPEELILAIDTGNTHTVLGCIRSNGKISPTLRMETNSSHTEYEYAADMSRILELEGVDPKSFTGSIISSVVPSMNETLKRAVRLITGLDAIVVGAGVKTGLDIGLDDPGTIAADLVATAVAAKEFYELPCFIIDMGTATTVTVVNEKGRYMGGAIYPGVGISLNALVQETSLLPDISVEPPKKAVATNTVDAMKSGMFYSTVGGLDGILDIFEKEFGQAKSIVATGGLAGRIAPYCRHSIKLADDLLLSGLDVIYHKNCSESRNKKKR
ncbi:MAG: type III pantothenate kinase [Lachnospiraceae bacterium]|jgi:type III pantothenate kinase|nr:type III pantothenate kinase [Lachnospiraceae bacterium]MDD4524611.1 type III pantothenate kinase [Lachnospiraceae bacterium]